MLLLLHLNIVPSPADAADAAASLFRPPTALTRLWVAVNVAIPPLLFFADWQKKTADCCPFPAVAWDRRMLHCTYIENIRVDDTYQV